MYTESPLADLWTALGRTDMSDQGLQAQQRARDVSSAEATAACMAERGFEYIPWFPGIGSVAETNGAVAFPTDPVEYASEWGYGALTVVQTATGSTDVDPNLAIRAGISEAGMAAYDEALFGGQTAATPDGIDLNASADEIGCWQWAELNSQFSSDAQRDALELVWNTPSYGELVDAASAVDNSPSYLNDMAVADAQWSECMDQRGFGYSSPFEAEDRFYAIKDGYRDAQTEGLSDDELIDLEISTATADQECREESGYNAALEQARWRGEAEVAQQYSSDLDSLLAALEQG